jgi:hypothetical protein
MKLRLTPVRPAQLGDRGASLVVVGLLVACGRPTETIVDAAAAPPAVPRSALPSAAVTAPASTASPAPSEELMDPEIALEKEDVLKFFAALRRSVNANDTRGVAKLVDFPVLVEVVNGARVTRVLSAGEFFRHYDEIVTPCIRDRINDTDPLRLHGGSKGFDIGVGQVWFSFTGHGPRIKAFNNHPEWCVNPKF